MDRSMPSRVSYWTGTWAPEREAISKEIEALRVRRRGAVVVAFSPGHGTSLSVRDRVLMLAGRRWLGLRIAAGMIERFADITHVFGPLSAWHLLRAVGRRPTIFTVVISGTSPGADLLRKVSCCVAETEALAAELVRAGVASSRVRIIRPGVDLQHFVPRPLPSGRFRLLFASTPSDPAEFEARGIPLLVQAARQLPDIDVVLQWRAWGNLPAAEAAFRALNPPSNVLVEHDVIRDMAPVYGACHATVACFAPGAGKSAPNSIIEGLAAGRPCIVSKSCGVGDIVQARGAGLAVEWSGRHVAAGIESLRAALLAYSARARQTAEDLFDLQRFLQDYEDLYEEIVRRGRPRPPERVPANSSSRTALPLHP